MAPNPRADKLRIEEMIPDKLRVVPDQELLAVNRRLHQLYGANFDGNDKMTAGELNREDLINAALFVWKEMLRRGMAVNQESALWRAAEHLRNAKSEWLTRDEASAFCVAKHWS